MWLSPDQTLTQVAKHYVGATAEEIAQLKRIASKLPSVPHELTPKNKALLRQFEFERLRAKLLFLPEQLVAEVGRISKRTASTSSNPKWQ